MNDSCTQIIFCQVAEAAFYLSAIAMALTFGYLLIKWFNGLDKMRDED